MLVIRLSRTGKKKQPSFRIVLAEKARAVKGNYKEVLGHYTPTGEPKTLEIKKDRIEYWISKGAQPSDTAATLFKKKGMDGMDQYISARDKKKKKKKGDGSSEGASA